MEKPVRMTVTFVLLSMASFCLMPSRAFGKTPEQIFLEVAGSIVVVVAVAKDAKDSSQGTGVVVAPNTVATNCHLFKSDIGIGIRYRTKAYPAKLKYQNWDSDLCILDVTGLSAPPLKSLVSVKQLRIGQPVYAIGTPFGLELTLTDGLISGFRKLGNEVLIQTSASIAPGSSGGGLFNSDGNLIGITSAGIPAYQGFNFAVPVDWISGILASIPKVTSIKTSEAARQALRVDILAGLPPTDADKAVPFLAFDTVEEARAWLDFASRRLQKVIADRRAREEFLVTAHYEAKRAGLDPGLILALIQVVSDFRKFATSKHDARGYMQVNAKWLRAIGNDSHNLFFLRTNLRYGCTIFRHYLERTDGDFYQALIAYRADMDPTPVRDVADFPNRVVHVWITNWKYS